MRSQFCKHLAGPAHLDVGEHVGMPAHQLLGNGSHDVVGAERALLAHELPQEDDLEQQIAELFAERRAIADIDGVDDLARLLENVAAQALRVLLAVPGAAVGGQETLHDLDQADVRFPLLLGPAGGRRPVQKEAPFAGV